MSHPQFVNREDELELLRSRFDRETADLLVVYGRRRLGKSALVREAIGERDDAVYWQATEETAAVQLETSSKRPARRFPSSRISNATGRQCCERSASRILSLSSMSFHT